MKKTSRIEIAREIISNLKREMERARWTDSLRDGLSVDPRPPSRGFPFGRFEGSAVKSNRRSFDCAALRSGWQHLWEGIWEGERDFIVRRKGPWLGLSSS